MNSSEKNERNKSVLMTFPIVVGIISDDIEINSSESISHSR